MDFKSMSNEALAAALTEKSAAAKTLFALTKPTVEQVDEVEALFSQIKEIEAEQRERAKVVKDAAARFAAARDAFTASAEDEDEGEDAEEEDSEEESETDAPETEAIETLEAAAKSDEGSAAEEADESPAEEDAEKKAMTASARKSQTIDASRKIARKVARPAVTETRKVTITAAADVQGFANGQALDDMEQVTKALLNRVKGFGKYNAQAALQAHSASGGEPVLNKFGVASFGIDFDPSLVASGANDYNAVKAALKQDRFSEEVLTAGGWCAPSENVYSFIADYVVDGLITVPEVSAPRGGINITTGPRVGGESQGQANLDNFGFTQTEAQAIARAVKTCETIDCPPFVDHRLDAIGYCFKIPLLTQKAYPEIVTDALRFANVLYAHKVNRRVISDLVALSTNVGYDGYGPSFTDALEALSLQAVKERRKWNIGENANMEVKIPVWVKEVFRADMSRRAAVTFDSVTDQMISKHFTDRHLAVEYVADWQELSETNLVRIVTPGTFKVMMYPSGTFVKAVEDVINLSAVYDAASLSVNEYTGVFFEQGILTAKAGYGSSLITIPVNTAGQMGALDLTGFGDFHANGSF